MKFVQAMAQAGLYTMNMEQTEELVAGLLEGLIAKDDLPELKKCMTHGEEISKEFTDVITKLESGNITTMISAITEIGTIVQTLPADFADCKDIQGDIAKVEKWGKQFLNPLTLSVTLAKNMWANHSAVTADISDMNTQMTAGKYFSAGEDIADVTVLALGKISLVREFQNEAHADMIKQSLF